MTTGEGRPVRKAAFSFIDDHFAVDTANRIDDVLHADAPQTDQEMNQQVDGFASAADLDGDLVNHVKDDWIGDAWFGDGPWEVLAKGFQAAFRVAQFRGCPVTATWVPVDEDGDTSVSVVVSPTVVQIILISPLPTGPVAGGTVAVAKMLPADFDPDDFVWPQDPRVLHIHAGNVDNALDVDAFIAALPSMPDAWPEPPPVSSSGA